MLLFLSFSVVCRETRKEKRKRKKEVAKRRKEKKKVVMVTDRGWCGRQELKRGNCDPGNLGKVELTAGQATTEYSLQVPRNAGNGRREKYVYVYVRY